MLVFPKDQTDTLRGLALLAVVWHHAVLWLNEGMLQWGVDKNLSNQAFQMVSGMLEPLRMPLFTILSGWVYAYRPVNGNNHEAFFLGKVRRIILPLLFVSTVSYFQILWINGETPTLKYMGQIFEVPPQELWMTFLFRLHHLWFLQAVFTFFMIILVVDHFGLMNRQKHWLIALLLTFVLPYLLKGSSLWSTTNTLHYMVYFFFGIGLYRFRDQLFSKRNRTIAAVFFIGAMGAVGAFKLDLMGSPSRLEIRPAYVLAGTAGSYLLLCLRLRIGWLAWLGAYSYTVYLYHGLGFEAHAFFDPLLNYGLLGSSSWFFLTLLLGLTIPIVIHKLVEPIPWVRVLVLGKKAVGALNQRAPLPASLIGTQR